MRLTVSTMPVFKRMGCFLKYYRKRILMISGIAFMVTVLLSICLTTFCSRSGLQGVVEKMVADIANADFYSQVANDAKVNVSGGQIQMGGASVNVNGIITTINGYLVGVGVVVAMVLWFPSVASTKISGQMYGEILIKRSIVLGVSIFMVMHSLEISQNIVNAGCEVVDRIAALASNSPVTLNPGDITSVLFDDVEDEEEFEEVPEEDTHHPIKQAINKIVMFLPNLGNKILTWLKKNVLIPLYAIIVLFIPWVIMAIIKALVSVFTVSRAVEIVILIMLSPIPFAIVGNEPLGQGAGARFIKNLFAVSLQGAVMVLVAFVCNSIAQGIIAGIGSVDDLAACAWRFIAVGFAEVSLLAKSLSISQKVFGLQ